MDDIWDDPNFLPQPYSEREAWLRIYCEPQRTNSRRLASLFRWTEKQVGDFFRKMTACGLVYQDDGHWIAVPPEEAARHPEYITGESWRHLRLRVLVRDGFRCAYCGEGGATHCDHVMPRVRGGLDLESNLVAACAACNLSKGGRTPEQWRPV